MITDFYRLKSLDLVCMKELDKKVNIIPIIAKADTVSRPELLQFKKKVSNWLFSLKLWCAVCLSISVCVLSMWAAYCNSVCN